MFFHNLSIFTSDDNSFVLNHIVKRNLIPVRLLWDHYKYDNTKIIVWILPYYLENVIVPCALTEQMKGLWIIYVNLLCLVISGQYNPWGLIEWGVFHFTWTKLFFSLTQTRKWKCPVDIDKAFSLWPSFWGTLQMTKIPTMLQKHWSIQKPFPAQDAWWVCEVLICHWSPPDSWLSSNSAVFYAKFILWMQIEGSLCPTDFTLSA